MLKRIFLFFVIILILSQSFYSSDDWPECDDCRTHPSKECCDEMPWMKICNPGNPGNDNADETLSYSDENGNRFYFITPDVLIYKRGYYEIYKNPKYGEKENALTDLNNSGETLLNSGRILIIPTGALFSVENDSTLKHVLEQYVNAGGTIIVFCQQYGSHVENVVPGGESLKVYGWRQSQSCLWGSIFFNKENMHPVLSAMTNEKVSAPVDGYFSQVPSGSQILLQRITNNEAALLMYPYGENGGHVILTSLYTDWGYAHSQASASELKLVRDLITFAKNPNLPISMYDLETDLNPQIDLNVTVKNNTEDTELTASKVKLVVYTPDRKIVLYETEQSVSLSAGAEAEIPISFTLPTLLNKDLGICHTDYELYDADNNLIQMASESDSGRFSIYYIKNTFKPESNYSVWVTAKKEFFYWYEQADLELHIKNYKDEPITMNWYYQWTHAGHYVLPEITVPANGEINYPVKLDLPQRTNYYGVSRIEMFWLFNRISENSSYRAATKGINVLYPRTRYTYVKVEQQEIKSVDPFNYTISTRNGLNTSLENTEIKVFLERPEWPSYTYVNIATIYEKVFNLGPKRTFIYSGTYMHPELLPMGLYRLRFEITKPDGSKSNAFTSFSVAKSLVNVKIEPIRDGLEVKKYLGINQTYPFKVTIENHRYRWGTGLNISNGKCILIVESETGEEAYREEVSDIAISVESSKSITRNFNFNPPVLGKYLLRVKYEDETGTLINTKESHFYDFKNYLGVNSDKTTYSFGETIGLNVEARGAGNFKLKVTCEQEGYEEERVINLSPENNNSIIERFEPIATLANSWNKKAIFRIEMKNMDPDCNGDSGVCNESRYYHIKRESIKVENEGKFSEISAKVGDPIDFTLKIKGLSGFISPLTGELRVYSSGLGFEDVKTVTISPGVEQIFNYKIPVPIEIAAGTYPIRVNFKVNERDLISSLYYINIPAPDLKFVDPPTVINAGDSMAIELENIGGKNGNFDIEMNLKDEKGKNILTINETRSINAGAQDSINITIPGNAKSSRYILIQKAKETITNKDFSKYSQIQVTGLEATLNSYTLKDKYFDNEIILGKSEITSGNGDIENGTLKARIVNYVKEQGGATEIEANSNIFKYKNFHRGTSFGNKLYLADEDGRLIEFDVVNKTAVLLLDLSGEYEEFEKIYVSSSGEIWVYGSNYGRIYRRDSSNTWHTYDGFSQIFDITELEDGGVNAIWMASAQGIQVYKEGVWSTYTTANGLPKNYVFKFAKDDLGNTWVSTEGGIVKFNGTSFEDVGAPFGSRNIYYYIGSTEDGSVWIVCYDFNGVDKLYHYRNGNWDEWNLNDIYPDLYIAEIQGDGNDVWFSGSNFSSNGNGYILIKYDTEFHIYENNTICNLYNNFYQQDTIIPFPGEGVYFLCEDSWFVEFKNSLWRKRALLDEPSLNQLPGLVTSICKDSQNNIWLGTENGISVYNGQIFQHFLETPDGHFIGRVSGISIDSNDKVFAAISEGILKIDGASMSLIPYPQNYILCFSDSDLQVATDRNSRIWINDWNYGTVYYYEGGTWHQLLENLWTNLIRDDGSGGLWTISQSDSYDDPIIIHISGDLSVQEFTSLNSGLIAGDIGSIYVDSSGVLWIAGWSMYTSTNIVQSFDGSNWIDYSNYDGFPTYKIYDVTKNDSGNLILIVSNGDDIETLYSLVNDSFIKDDVEFDMGDPTQRPPLFIFSNNIAYCVVSEVQEEPTRMDGIPLKLDDITVGLIKISSIAQSAEKVQWSSTYPINLSVGSSIDIDLNTDKTLDAGSYLLKTEVHTSSDQVLCESDHPFVVRGTDVSVTLSANVYNGKYVKRDTDLIVNIEAFNNTDETKNNLALIVKKISPQQIEEEIVNQSISLAPGEAFTDNITFNENEQGLWKVHTEIKEGDTLISESEMVVEVTVPVVSMEILSPEYAGDDAFDFKVKLFNNGSIETNIHVNVEANGGSPDLIDEDITLKPMEQRVLSANDTITADKTYNITLSGDVENTEEKIVQYGYKEVFTINVLQLYREGSISIGYDISNTGGLAFKDDVHFELFIVGATEPLYTIDRTYNLYPGADVITDTLDFSLVPGNYILKYHTTKSAEAESQFNVQASGIGTVNITSGVKYPVGVNDVLYNITNADTVAGNIEIAISLLKNGSPVFSDTRNYYVEPSEIREDVIDYEFAEKGDYILSITGTKLSAPVNITLNILNMKEVAGNLSIEAPQINNIPVEVNINNTGYDDFSGRVVIKAGEMLHEETVTVASGNQYTGTVYFDTCALFAGNVQVNAYLYDSAGELLNEVTSNVVISGPDVKVIEVPENLEITAGGFAQTSIKLKNEGNLRGEVVLKMTAFDTVDEQCEIALDPGEEKEISDIYIDVAGDIPTGNYPFNYTLSGMGVENGFLSGNFSFKVNGVSLDVSADFEYDVYQVGETGVLTITVNPETPTEAPLEAVVNWGEYNERVPFNVSSGMEQLVFNIPVDEKRDDKVFYGIYHEDGKGIYLNDIYLNIGGAVNVVLDKQVYAPGDVVHAVFSTDESGVITAEAFGENYTITLSSSGSIDFTVPEHTLGGSYGVSWEFVPSDPLHESVSGGKPFDVSGLVVKVAKSELEKGKYAPGESIKATYTFESNMDEALNLRCWVVAPSGDWEYLGDSEVSVSGSSHVNAATSYSFNTTQAGTHNFVYGLYRGNQLVVSGSMGFDVGDAVLIGVSTDHFEYKDGNEDVKVKVDYFGQGTALLEVYLDEELAETRSLNLIGSGSSEIVLSNSQVSGGTHNIKALLKKDGLTSEKQTSFIYGTNLPDLSVSMWELNRDNLDYQYKISVRNSGKTASAATTLIFSDNGTDVETVSISALQPGESVEHDFAWSGIGKAGSHELKFEVDRANTVKEFSESNNTLEITEEVPSVFYNLNIEPEIWQANSEVNIITRLINNQNTTATFDLELSITSNATGEVIYEKTNTYECAPFEQKVINEGFNTGVYPAGEYMLVQHLTGDNADLTEEIGVIIEVTKAIDATLTIAPERIPCDVDSEVELSMNLKNMGNVALEDEVLIIEVMSKDSEEIVKTEEMLVSLGIGAEKQETKVLALNLVEGMYEVRLKFNEEVIAQSELEVKPGLEMEKGVVIEPRVLIMNLRFLGIDGTQLGFLISLLQSQDIKYTSGNYILDSYVKFHNVENNVNIAFVGSSFWGIRDELRERVWRGEGLIVICNKVSYNPETVDFLGVKVKNIPKKNREKDMEMLSSAISAEGDFVLLKKNCLKLEKQKDDVFIIGRSKTHKNAVIAYRRYGNGYVMIICAPLKFSSGSGNIAQTIANAVRLFSRDVYTISDLSRILPLGISLKNEAGDEKSYIVKEIQPYGVKGYGYEPQPDEGEELKWTLTIPGSSESRIFYWLKLPDEINSYDIKTEIYEDENKIDEKSVMFEVSQIVLSRIDEIIADIESLNVSGSDFAYLNVAKHKLQNIRNRTGDSIIKILLNLKDSIKAGKNVGKVKNIDVSYIRMKIHNIMMFFSRTLYDKLIGLSSIEINSLSGTMFKDD